MGTGRTYKANLQRTGALVDETITLLKECARLGDWEAVRHSALHTNLLGKGATKTVSELLFVVQRRLLIVRPGLPSWLIPRPAQTIVENALWMLPNRPRHFSGSARTPAHL